MFDSGARCPGCWATTLIRTKQTGAYQPGECMNCRADRSAELPGHETPATTYLPEGVSKLPGGRFKLPDGSTIKGYDAMIAAVNKE